MVKQILFLFLLIGSIITACAPSKENDALVKVDCSKIVNENLQLGGYFNNSLRKAPPIEFPEKVATEFGKPKITRCWLTLDDMWDYRTNEYRHNFIIGKNYYEGDTVKNTYKGKNPMALELESDVPFEKYLKSFSDHSEEILLNVRRYETEVLNGILTIEEWKEVLKSGLTHYKKLCPNLRYIEVLNESTVPHFGGVADEQYYLFYKAAYQVINEINSTLQPEMPLLIGGSANHYKHGLDHFFKDFAADKNPNKQLDFVSYHEYGAGNNPAKFAQHENEVKQKLEKFGLNTKLPQFITEMGYVGRTTEHWEDNFKQACFVTAAIYQARNSKNLTIFPWVLYHTHKQTSHVMYNNSLELTPFGNAMKMLTMHKAKEVFVESDSIKMDGTGLGVLASTDGKSLVIEFWNYSEKPFKGNVLIENLPEEISGGKIMVKEYIINKETNNNFTPEAKQDQMVYNTNTFTLSVNDKVSMPADMQPMSLLLWEVSGE